MILRIQVLYRGYVNTSQAYSLLEELFNPFHVIAPLYFSSSSILLRLLQNTRKYWNKEKLWLEIGYTILLSDSPIKLSNTLKQFVGKLPTNCLSVFDNFVGLALKGLVFLIWTSLRDCIYFFSRIILGKKFCEDLWIFHFRESLKRIVRFKYP